MGASSQQKVLITFVKKIARKVAEKVVCWNLAKRKAVTLKRFFFAG